MVHNFSHHKHCHSCVKKSCCIWLPLILPALSYWFGLKGQTNLPGEAKSDLGGSHPDREVNWCRLNFSLQSMENSGQMELITWLLMSWICIIVGHHETCYSNLFMNAFHLVSWKSLWPRHAKWVSVNTIWNVNLQCKYSTYWGLSKMSKTLQTKLSYAFSWTDFFPKHWINFRILQNTAIASQPWSKL